jgi:hypothetical protein
MVPSIAFAAVLGVLVQEPEPFSPGSRVFCPICVSNGYASSTAAKDKVWFLTGNSVGGALWNRSIPRWQLGIGTHGKSRSVRGLVSYRAIPERNGSVGLNLGYGIQSQETGATGFSTTAEWNPGNGNVFGGFSLETGDRRLRPVAGFKWSPLPNWFIGNQYDGRHHNPFVQRTFGDISLGLLSVAGKSLTLTAGVSF